MPKLVINDLCSGWFRYATNIDPNWSSCAHSAVSRGVSKRNEAERASFSIMWWLLYKLPKCTQNGGLQPKSHTRTYSPSTLMTVYFRFFVVNFRMSLKGHEKRKQEKKQKILGLISCLKQPYSPNTVTCAFRLSIAKICAGRVDMMGLNSSAWCFYNQNITNI